MDPNNAIEIRDVDLTYTYTTLELNEKTPHLKKYIKTKTENHVLDKINLDVKKGEILGIIGTNGAGKSTLLSIMARILEPDSGTIHIDGKVATILELGMGFHADLSGRENIILKGELYGFSKKEMEAKTEQIIDYSGIRRYIDNPVRTYSSGMRSRLAFSIMIHVEQEVMLVDEILSTGDLTFSAKASDFFKKILKDGKTVVFVSHASGSIESICTRAIWLDKGRIVADGKPKKIVDMYRNATMDSLEVVLDQAKSGMSDAQYRLSQFYKEGDHVERDLQAYRYWLELSAEQGHLKAQVELADILMEEDESNRETAILYYQSSAARGDAQARSRLSAMFGIGNSCSLRESLRKTFEHCARLGKPQDMYRYAEFLYKAAWDKDDTEEAFKWFNRVATEFNHPYAITQLATMYRYGIGTKRDNTLFIETLERGCQLGVPKAMKMLADQYQAGINVEEDHIKALTLYEKSAELGVSSSQYEVAMIYLEGKDVEPDLEKATYWFEVYQNSQLEPYQLQMIELLKENSAPGLPRYREEYWKVIKSKNPKVLSVVANRIMKSRKNITCSEEILDMFRVLASYPGVGMTLAYRYYSRISHPEKDKLIDQLLERMIYLGDPKLLYEFAIRNINCHDKREQAIVCMRLQAKLGDENAVCYCKENQDTISMPPVDQAQIDPDQPAEG